MKQLQQKQSRLAIEAFIQWAIGFMARLARRRVIVRSDTYSSSSHLELSSCKSVGSLYSSISLRHKVAATTRQLATTRSPIRMSRRWSHHLSFSHQSPVSDDTDYFIRAPATVSNVLSGWISSQFFICYERRPTRRVGMLLRSQRQSAQAWTECRWRFVEGDIQPGDAFDWPTSRTKH